MVSLIKFCRKTVKKIKHPVTGKLLLIGLLPLFPQALVSIFNIWYNLTHIYPLLTETQLAAFLNAVKWFNVLVYPLGFGAWIYILSSIWSACYTVSQGTSAKVTNQNHLLNAIDPARRRAINLPWWSILIVGGGNFLGLPVFLLVLLTAPGSLNQQVLIDLPVSLTIGGLMSISQVFLLVEILSVRLIYPILFQDALPSRQSGIIQLSLLWRGILLVISNAICPILALLLLSISPYRSSQDTGFALGVAGTSILFGLSSAWMVSILVREPVNALKVAAISTAQGNLNQQINLLRADEFGPLIDEFNHMLSELRQKQLIEETFGRHVGRQAAMEILQRDPGLGGAEQEITVMFADLRNFTQRCVNLSPTAAIKLLNQFLTAMVTIVEDRYQGMVNKFLGDGFMAIFGVGQTTNSHGYAAVQAGQEMLMALEEINQAMIAAEQLPLKMGIGIHTGPAVVGSMGSPQRLEYTAIGDTVNLASRVESLTKEVGIPLLFTAATAAQLPSKLQPIVLTPRPVKGQPEPIPIFSLPNNFPLE